MWNTWLQVGYGRPPTVLRPKDVKPSEVVQGHAKMKAGHDGVGTKDTKGVSLMQIEMIDR